MAELAQWEEQTLSRDDTDTSPTADEFVNVSWVS